MADKKVYVVWKGRNPGIYLSWDACKEQVDGFQGAKYQSFKTMAEAEYAYVNAKPQIQKKNIFREISNVTTKPLLQSIVVDAACNVDTGEMEYRGISFESKKILFQQGPFKDGTNNIGEFLAIVHALAYCKKNNLQLTIYSDSKTALAWLKKKKANTKAEATNNNQILFELIERAENWLKQNSYSNPVLKWETELWGENPADYGRK